MCDVYTYAFGKHFFSKQLVSHLGMCRDILRGWGSSGTSTMGTFFIYLNFLSSESESRDMWSTHTLNLRSAFFFLIKYIKG